MKKITNLILLILTTSVSFGQNPSNEYYKLVTKADSLYEAKDYLNSGLVYSRAFEIKGWKIRANDRYNAACSWALAKVPDSSFYQLESKEIKRSYTNYDHTIIDEDLASLHNDKRWAAFLKEVKRNKLKKEAKLNSILVTELKALNDENQNLLKDMPEFVNKNGSNTQKMLAFNKTIDEGKTKIKQKIDAIIAKDGWPSSDLLGLKGEYILSALVMSLDLKDSKKYLPLIKESVKKGESMPEYLAMYEDRFLTMQNKKQIYGTQVGQDPQTKTYYILPLTDPENVDKRRGEIYLSPLSEYIKVWKMKWDAKQYIKDLPSIEKKLGSHYQ